MGNYAELWKRLGVDLKRHDKLCEVLPEIYSSVYLNQEDRPEGMNYFNMVISEIHGLRIEELDKERAKGRKVVGTFCVFVPDEVILALDAISIGLCAGSEFWVQSGETVMPKNMCPLIKAFMGAATDATCPYYLSTDLIVGETTCDGKKKAWEIMKDKKDIYVMDLPQMKREKDILHWKEEILAFIDRMEKLTGNKLTVEKLKAGIKLCNEKRRALKRLNDLRKNKPSPISGLDCLLITQIAFYDDPKRFIENTNKLCDELEERVKSGKIKNNKKRILVTGTPMAVPNWKLHSLIESLDAEVVLEESCTGSRYFENEVSEEGDTIEELAYNIAKRYMKINCACFTPNGGRAEDIVRYSKEYKVDGVIDYCLSFCHTYAVEHRSLKKVLEENNIPILRIETDYSNEDAGQLTTRIEAFLEMI